MNTDPLFEIPSSDPTQTVVITFEGEELRVPGTINVAAALLTHGVCDFRTTAISEAPRAPFCMMGVCFECLVEIDGVAARQSCLIPVRHGMAIRQQRGAVELNSDAAVEPTHE